VSAGIYLHIPFCKSRCSYCDFATDVYRSSGAVARYVSALCKEISAFHGRDGIVTGGFRNGSRGGVEAISEPAASPIVVDTVYFGGGTPSLLTPAQVEKILDTVRISFDLESDPEITMEMNPATVTPQALAAYRSLGVNRASFGVQTFNDRDLKLLSRGHDSDDARNTYAMLRNAGFENISFDLIAGLPSQSLDNWRRNLDEAIAMSPEHLSLYLLEIHDGTPLAEQVRSGRRPVPDEDLAAEMYDLMCDRLHSAGYQQYEISNFARSGDVSRHNTKYWRLEPVYGFGVSAHSFDGAERYANERDTNRYVELIETAGTAEVSRESVDTVAEYIFLGLRLNEGISYVDFERKFGRSINDIYHSQLIELQELGLLNADQSHVELTPRGRLFSNEVFTRFI
jgi:oxygen-independent coproporphyrinogen-3 oxidase